MERLLESDVLDLVLKYGTGGMPQTKSLGEEIYGEMYFPMFKDKKFMRKTKDRFKQFRIESLTGLTVLDVGCHIGSLSFYSHQLGAEVVHGLELNEDRVKTANAIKKYHDLKNIEFTSTKDNLFDKYDVVLCCSVDDYVEDPSEFYDFLFSKTKGRLILESNIQTYTTHPVAEWAIDRKIKYNWLGEVVDKYPFGKDRVRNLVLI